MSTGRGPGAGGKAWGSGEGLAGGFWLAPARRGLTSLDQVRGAAASCEESWTGDVEPGLPGPGVSAPPVKGYPCRGRLSSESQGLEAWNGAQYAMLRQWPSCPQGWAAGPSHLAFPHLLQPAQKVPRNSTLSVYRKLQHFPRGLKNGEGGVQFKTS